MFLVTLLDTRLHKRIRKAFHYITDAEEYCDWVNNYKPELDIFELAYCDFFPEFEEVE